LNYTIKCRLLLIFLIQVCDSVIIITTVFATSEKPALQCGEVGANRSKPTVSFTCVSADGLGNAGELLLCFLGEMGYNVDIWYNRNRIRRYGWYI